MRSTDFRNIVEPILNEEFDGVYEQRADEWNQVFKQITGIPRSFHEEPVLYGFSAAPLLPDGQPVTYQAGGQLFVYRYFYQVYGLAFALTKVLVEQEGFARIKFLECRDDLVQFGLHTASTPSFRGDAKHRTRNLEIPGLVLRTIPE